MTKRVCKISRLNSKRLLRKPQMMLGGYFILPHPVEYSKSISWLAIWFSGNALALINVVALRQTRLVPGRVTVCGPVNHLGM